MFQKNSILVLDGKFQKEYAFTSNTDEKKDLLCIFQVEVGFKSTLLFTLTYTNIESFLLNFDNTNIKTFSLNFDNKIKCAKIRDFNVERKKLSMTARPVKYCFKYLFAILHNLTLKTIPQNKINY